MKLKILTLALAFSAGSSLAEERPITYVPEGGYVSTVPTTYVDPSVDNALEPGHKISDLTARNFAGETILQRLTDRSYWVQTGFYNAIFYVGDSSVLLVDPLGYGAGDAVLAAIRDVTERPIDTIILSHHHEDHIGDLPIFAEAAEDGGHDLRVIASAETAANHDDVTDVIESGQESVQFEDLTIRLLRFESPAHTYDSTAWLLEQEAILHAPDMLNPDQMPYRGFGGSATFRGLEDNIATLAAQDFTFFSGGHGNIGGPEDIAFMQRWLADLKQAVIGSYDAVEIADYFVPDYGNHQASATAWYKAMNKVALDNLRKEYGDFYGFEASVPVQIDMVRSALEY